MKGFYKALDFERVLEILRTHLRLFQNFSFWNSYLRFRGKTGFFPVFPEPVPKLTEFWNRLICFVNN
jgi:hypothetical protein